MQRNAHLVLTFIIVFVSSSHAQDREAEANVPEVSLCDLLAAHSADKLRRSEGVEDESVVPGLAVPACENAVSTDNSPLNRFQLGRAYLSAGREQDAARQFEEAAAAGHAIAAGYAGDAYLLGRGVEKDTERAKSHYENALAGGFDAAQAMIEAITFDGSIFMTTMPVGIYQGIPTLSEKLDLRRALPLAGYVYSFASSLNAECRGTLTPKTLSMLLKVRHAIPAEAQDTADFAMLSASGEYDAQTFVQRHGCDGPVTERINANLSAYIALHN